MPNGSSASVKRCIVIRPSLIIRRVGHCLAMPGAALSFVCFVTRGRLASTDAWLSQRVCYRRLIARPAANPSPRIILAVLSLGGISYALLQSLVVPALPEIQRSLHTTE